MITRRARNYYHELQASQYLPPEKIRELQEKKLRRLITHAYYHVAYYRERMDALGLTPSDIRGLEDLRKLPLLGKDDVRENLHFDLLSDNHEKRKILKITTSGSTGEPFVCYADQHQLEIRWAATQRSMEWTGYRFGDRCARLWHQTLGMSWPQILRERIDAWFNRRLFIPAFEMSDQNIAELRGQAARVPAGAARRLRGVVQLPRPLHPESRARELPPQGGDLVGAGAARAEPRDHREDPRLRRLRQVRQPRVLRASPTSAKRTPATTSSPRATWSRS